MRNVRTIFRMVILILFAVQLCIPVSEVWAGPRRGGARPSVSRHGPASMGSMGHRERRTSDRGARGPDYNRERSERRYETRRVERDPVEREERLPATQSDRVDSRYDRRTPEERRDHVRDERRDYYEDRYRFRRGVRYSSTWWTTTCSSATVVVVDNYTYYECETGWFSRTYYGGEVIYTVTDAPAGY